MFLTFDIDLNIAYQTVLNLLWKWISSNFIRDIINETLFCTVLTVFFFVYRCQIFTWASLKACPCNKVAWAWDTRAAPCRTDPCKAKDRCTRRTILCSRTPWCPRMPCRTRMGMAFLSTRSLLFTIRLPSQDKLQTSILTSSTTCLPRTPAISPRRSSSTP